MDGLLFTLAVCLTFSSLIVAPFVYIVSKFYKLYVREKQRKLEREQARQKRLKEEAERDRKFARIYERLKSFQIEELNRIIARSKEESTNDAQAEDAQAEATVARKILSVRERKKKEEERSKQQKERKRRQEEFAQKAKINKSFLDNDAAFAQTTRRNTINPRTHPVSSTSTGRYRYGPYSINITVKNGKPFLKMGVAEAQQMVRETIDDIKKDLDSTKQDLLDTVKNDLL